MRRLLAVTWLVSFRAQGGRLRLIGTAAGIAVGTMLLLLVLAAYQGMSERAVRADAYSYIGNDGETRLGFAALEQGDLLTRIDAGERPNADEFVVLSTGIGSNFERFREREILRVDVGVTEDSRAQINGVQRMPRAGQYVASPALIELIAQHPPEELERRYGRFAGKIEESGLASPDSLLVIVGHDPAELARTSGALMPDELSGTAFASQSYLIIAIIGGLAVLFPVVVLIGIVTKLGHAAREERTAVLALIGASPVSLATMTAIETAAVAIIGAVVGIALYLGVVPLVAQMRVEHERFFVADLLLDPLAIAFVTLVMLVTSTLAAFVSASRTRGGPLGASRERIETRPRLARLIPLALGLLAMGLVLIGSRLLDNDGGIELDHELRFVVLQTMNLAVVPSFVLIMWGIVLAGPLFLSWVSRIAVKFARSAEGVLALNRLSRHPVATFRTVTGMVIAVFVVTVFAVGMTAAQSSGSDTNLAVEDSNDQLTGHPARTDRISPDALITHLPQRAVEEAGEHKLQQVRGAADRISSLKGVTGAHLVLRPSDELPQSSGNVFLLLADDARALGMEVPGEAFAVNVNAEYFSTFPVVPPQVQVGPATEQQLENSIPELLVVVTDGDTSALERARAAILSDQSLYDPVFSAYTHAEIREGNSEGTLGWAAQYANLAHLGIIIAMLISGVSLAVSTVAGVLDRRRALGLLRLTGMPAERLRRMISLEAWVPVASTFLVCVGLGVFVAWALIYSLSAERSIGWPEPGHYLALAGGLGLTAVAIFATFGTVRRATALTSTRFE